MGTASIARTVIFLAAAVVAAPLLVLAQSPAPAPGPAPAPASGKQRIQGILSHLPPQTKPCPGHGESLLLNSAAGKSCVGQLYCGLDPMAIVMLPTGAFEFVERAKTQPTTKPFVAATAEEISKSLKVPEASKYKIESGKFYCYAYHCSEGFFMHTRSILETMLPGVVLDLRCWGLDMNPPAVPMVVVIMPSRAAFDAYQPMPREVAAYYDILGNQIVMYEDQELVDAAPEFAAKQAAYVVAHEGVHQLLANCGIQRRLSNWAPWISEGIAEYYCPLKVQSSILRQGNAELPERTMKWSKAGMVNDLRMYGLLKMRASGQALKQLVEAENLDGDGYALAWGLVHFLANKKPDAFRAYLASVSRYEPLDDATAPVAGKPDALFVKHFGNDFEQIVRELQAYLTSKSMQTEYVDPIANQTHYVVKSIQKQGKAFAVKVGITTSPAAARAFKEQEEAGNKNGTFTTTVCSSRDKALRQAQLMGRK